MSIVAGLAFALVMPQASFAATAGPPARERKGSADPRQKRVKKGKAGKATPVLIPAAAPVPLPAPSEATARLLTWVAAAHDNGRLPYIVIDKQSASLFLFGAKGDLIGQVPVLLGVGVGDDSSPGVGAKSLAEIGPAERTTPAGRFVAKFGRAFGGQRVLWVDYANSVAIHAVITTNKQEQRVQRLLSPTPDDNRITFGCVNVGTSFYSKKLRPLFQRKGGIVYILPDTRPLDDVFPRVRLAPYLGDAAPN